MSDTSPEDLADFVVKCVKGAMLDEPDTQVWIDQMKLKCQAYIHNNGIKTTTVDEVVDFLKEDALKTFPKNVTIKCEELAKEIEESLNQ